MAIEIDANSAAVIKESANRLHVAEFQVIIGDAFKEVTRLTPMSFDLVFVDPPYRISLTAEFWRHLLRLLSDDASVVFRCEKQSDFVDPDGFEVFRARQYGGTAVFFLRRRHENSDIPR